MKFFLSREIIFILLTFSAFGVHSQSLRWVPQGDGSEVKDINSGLIWKRCAEGMQWKGNGCNGSPLLMSHEQALAHARVQVGWRLPNIKELDTIVDRSFINPAVDLAVFPGTPAARFWSSSPFVSDSNYARYVHFYDGYDGLNGGPRSDTNLVRLVRLTQ